jgi:uncharacterized short protein YbdD (DUF466 family)
MRETIVQWWRRARQTGLLMVGVPDYANYLAHMEKHHPGHAVLSEAQWVARAQEARFGGKKIGKCPC